MGARGVIAALFVDEAGCYAGLDDVWVWGPTRDARTYAGPHPVVAHPPCARWGRYWFGGPSARVRRRRGDDDGCFAAALRAVQVWGGVLEHPEASSAFVAHGLASPPKAGGWVPAGLWAPGWTCCVEQGHYGHSARKATWLYYVGAKAPPELVWGKARGKARLDQGFHSAAERRVSTSRSAVALTSKRQREATPPAFRDVLLEIARGAR